MIRRPPNEQMDAATPAGPVRHAPTLHVWYVCDWARCDLACRYCISRVHRHASTAAAHEGWTAAGSGERHRRIVEWISRLPFEVGVRLQTIGEPLLSDDVLMRAGLLSRQPRTRFVELVTNGAALPRRLPTLLEHCRPDRVSLWITHHAGQVAAEDLADHAALARDAGLSVVVNALAFPQTLDAIDDLCHLCRQRHIPVNLDLGLDVDALRQGFSGIPVLQEPFVGRLRALPGGRDAERRATLGRSPRGRPCSAGRDYIFIAQDGGVYPCWASSKSRPQARTGSALDPDFLPPTAAGYAPCPVSSPCICAEDLSHLAGYGLAGPRTTSIRWATASPAGGAPASDAPLVPAADGRRERRRGPS